MTGLMSSTSEPISSGPFGPSAALGVPATGAFSSSSSLSQAPLSHTQGVPFAAGHTPKLDGLLSHLSGNMGLYSRATFLNLFGSFIRMIRDQGLQGLVLTLTRGQEDFDLMTVALENLRGLELMRLDGLEVAQQGNIVSPEMGLLVVITDRLSGYLFWSTKTDDAFRMYQGGWTFHPGDTRTLATNLTQWFGDEPLQQALEAAPMDRRYDEKLTMLVSSLVNNLENRNRELTLALERENQLNKRMVEQERLAAIGQLCSVIAHEIRNPLGLIDLYAKLVETQLGKLDGLETADQEPIGKNLQQIRHATQSLETILSELTQYSRPLQLDLERCDIVPLVGDICEFYRPSYDEKGVQLLVPPPAIASEDGPQEQLWVEVDRGRFRQALINLLKNALEATEAGKKVQVQVASRLGDDQVYIKVRDEGTGIKPEARHKLFTPYFSTKGGGTGLGLAHVRKILQAHGGNADCLSSEPGQGSSFALVLPRL